MCKEVSMQGENIFARICRKRLKNNLGIFLTINLCILVFSYD